MVLYVKPNRYNMLGKKARQLLFSAIIISLLFSSSSAQSYPQDFDYSIFTDALIDAGYIWKYNSSFHPIACLGDCSLVEPSSDYKAHSWMFDYLREYSSRQRLLEKEAADGLGVFFLPGISAAKQEGDGAKYDKLAFQPFIWSRVVFHKNWYAEAYIRGTNEKLSLSHYSGDTRAIERGGFNSAEFDRLAIGYHNSWANIEFGRSREIWGPFSEDNLMLSGVAPSYERLMFQLCYKRFSFRWFYGFLETVQDDEGFNVNRYLTGRALEYRNGGNLVISAGEISTLAGRNRPVDFAFLNPLGFHVEVEEQVLLSLQISFFTFSIQ